MILGLILRAVRYLVDFPLWCDEARLAANLINLNYHDLGQPLSHAQVCPVGFLAVETTLVRLLGYSTWSLRLAPLLSAMASVVLFRHLARRLLSGLPAMLAVAIFAVSWWPIGFAAEVKPYATDLLVSLALFAAAVEWLKTRRTAWLWGLAAASVVAIPLSLPSIFVVGGTALALVATVRQSRQRCLGRLALARRRPLRGLPRVAAHLQARSRSRCLHAELLGGRVSAPRQPSPSRRLAARSPYGDPLCVPDRIRLGRERADVVVLFCRRRSQFLARRSPQNGRARSVDARSPSVSSRPSCTDTLMPTSPERCSSSFPPFASFPRRGSSASRAACPRGDRSDR